MRLRKFWLLLAALALFLCAGARGEALSIACERDTLGLEECLPLEVSGGEGGYTFASSRANVVSVGEDGTVTAVGVGEATITATDAKGESASLVFAVLRAPKTISLKGNPDAIGLGESLALAYTLNDGSAGGATFSVKNAKVLSVDESGTVTGLSAGSTTVYATTYNGKRAEWKLTVSKAPTTLALNVYEAQLGVGQAGKLTAKVNKGAANHVSFASSNPEIASVDAQGQVTGVSAGEATITACTYNGLSQTCVVRVYPAPEAARVIAARTVLGAGESFMAACAFTPEDAVGKVVYSSGNANVLAVSAEGKVIARKAGQATIIATLENGITAEIAVQVYARPEYVKLKAPHNPMGVGESMALVVSYSKNAYGSVSFHSRNTKVVTVDENGVVTALARGKATIDVRTYNGCTDSVLLYVTDGPKSIYASEALVQLGAGETHMLTATVKDGAGGYTFACVQNDVCAVTPEGEITAIAPGSAVVTVTAYNGVSDTCEVRVYAAPEAVTASIPRDVLGAGESAQLACALSPAETRAQILYASSNPSVAAVDENGRVSAKAAGTAVITIGAYNGVKTEIPITVCAAPKRVIVQAERAILAVGDSCALTYAPDAGAAGQIALSCDRTDVLGYENGKIIALAAGTARVKATAYNGASGEVEITVKEPAQWIAFGAAEYWMSAGQIATADIRYEADAYAEITYVCEDESVCVFLADGELMAISEGEAVVTATTERGVTAKTTVRVSGGGAGGDVDLRKTSLTAREAAELQAKYPNVRFVWELTVLGQKILSTDTALNLSKRGLSDLNAVRAAIDALPRLTQVDLSYNGFSNEALAELREEYRGRVKIVWTIDIYRWSIRTDDTAFSTLLDDYSLPHSSAEFDPLKYCEDLEALDLGHNKIKDMSFLLSLKKLKILILAVNDISDVTQLGEITTLEYLELFTNKITDIAPLANLVNLLDLNLSNNKVDDITPLLQLPKLERLWMTHNLVSSAEIAQLREAHPDCEMNFDAPGPDRRGWRSHQRYFVLYQIFHTNVYVPWDTEVPEPPNYRAYY